VMYAAWTHRVHPPPAPSVSRNLRNSEESPMPVAPGKTQQLSATPQRRELWCFASKSCGAVTSWSRHVYSVHLHTHLTDARLITELDVKGQSTRVKSRLWMVHQPTVAVVDPPNLPCLIQLPIPKTSTYFHPREAENVSRS
jgi:hypothetical protein